jgi:hypothetical protein
MCSVISVLSVCGDIVHVYLLLLWPEVILASFDGAAPVRAGVREVMGVVLVGQANNTPTLSFCSTKVVQRFAILVEMTRYLAVAAGMAAVTASEAS